MTTHWDMTRKFIRWISAVAIVAAIPLVLAGHDFGWILVIIAVGGISTLPSYDDWAPYRFPTRMERKAVQSELMPR